MEALNAFCDDDFTAFSKRSSGCIASADCWSPSRVVDAVIKGEANISDVHRAGDRCCTWFCVSDPANALRHPFFSDGEATLDF
uniref:Uncharacterized protein n=1 Tax=Rhizophora mucronata TaxID=61149 RepID=A0A2P2N062_RHIMU